MKRSVVRMIHGLVILMFVGIFTGCLGNRDWEYPPSSTGAYLGLKAKNSIPAKAVVLPFEDLRGQNTKEEYWMAAIPLVRNGETKYDRPEEATDPEEVDVVNFDPPNDFAKATAAELQEAGLFSSVEFAEGGKIPPTDLVFRGRLQSTEWERKLDTYFLGPVGVFLLVFRGPNGRNRNSRGT